MKGETVGDFSKIYHGMLSTVATLEGIKRPITDCSDLFVHLIVDRMSTRTRSEWEDSIGSSSDPPSLEQLSKFMEHRMHTLEASDCSEERLPWSRSTFSSYKEAELEIMRDAHAARKILCLILREV